MTERLILLGFGNVGTALAELITAKRSEVRESYGLDLQVVAIATGSHGIAYDPDGLDLERAVKLRRQGGNLSELSRQGPPESVEALLEIASAEAVLESVPVDYEGGRPALDYLRLALSQGMHAITANKGPVVHGYRELSEIAQGYGRRFLFESTVLDGTPIFSTWRECLPGARLESFRGVLNSTTNFLLGAMEGGMTFETAVAEAQSIGVAETNPAGDIDGWDAAVKVAAVVTVLMDTPLGIAEVEREGIRDVGADQVKEAAENGQRWKLICRGWRENEGVRGSVRPEKVGPADPLYHVNGTSSMITFSSDVLGDLTIMGGNPGPATTAYGMFADLLNAM